MKGEYDVKAKRVTARIEPRYHEWLRRKAAKARETSSTTLRRLIYAAFDSERRGA
jgi:hypothetical protein